jgi:myo-inositol-1(or 4)-monophosphatase
MSKRYTNTRLAIAKVAARKAGEVLTDFYARRSQLQIDTKGPNDFVSAADRQAEQRILGILRERFPNDGFIGEETGISGSASSEFQWCIDPLDGTSNFLKGGHNWCVSIGLLQHGRPVAGVIYDPIRKEMFEGGDGLGVRCNGKELHVTEESEPTRSTVGIGHVSRIPVSVFSTDTARFLEAGFGFRQVGAGALMLAYVAAGRVDLYFERHMWPWDAIAGLALIEAAGGRFLPYIEDRPGAGALVLAGVPALVDKVASILSVG